MKSNEKRKIYRIKEKNRKHFFNAYFASVKSKLLQWHKPRYTAQLFPPIPLLPISSNCGTTRPNIARSYARNRTITWNTHFLFYQGIVRWAWKKKRGQNGFASSYKRLDRYRPQDKRRITGIKQHPRCRRPSLSSGSCPVLVPPLS